MRLPRGVALVRIQTTEERVTLVADSLTEDQELAARVYAAVLAAEGQEFIMLMKTDVLAALHAAA